MPKQIFQRPQPVNRTNWGKQPGKPGTPFPPKKKVTVPKPQQPAEEPVKGK